MYHRTKNVKYCKFQNIPFNGTFFVSIGVAVVAVHIKVDKENAKIPISRSELPEYVVAGVFENIWNIWTF